MSIAYDWAMDVISEPGFTEETVTDLGFMFSGCPPLELTLREGDTYDPIEGVITLHNPPETIRLFTGHLCWGSQRTRVIRTPITVAKSAQS